jgi:hypothetical protein
VCFVTEKVVGVFVRFRAPVVNEFNVSLKLLNLISKIDRSRRVIR